MNFNLPSRDIKWAARCKSLELNEELRARNRNVKLINIWMVHKAMGMNESISQLGVDGEESQGLSRGYSKM